MNETLTAADRCDRCGAQAKAVLQTEAGKLYFCGHDAVALPSDRKSQLTWADGEAEHLSVRKADRAAAHRPA